MKKITWRKLQARYRYSIILLKELVRTDFKVRYQGSVLGYLWSLLRPLFLFVIMYFVFVEFLRIGQGIPHWPVGLLFGIVMWNFFSEITNQGLKSIVTRSGVIRKINFPKYIIIFSVSISAAINLFFNMVIVLVFIAINHVPLTWTMLLAPVFIFEIFIFALGCAFLLSTLYVKIRDMNFIWDIIMQGLFYASAIMFPMSKVADKDPHIAKLLTLNPIAQSISDARHMLIPSSMTSSRVYLGDGLLIIIPLGIVLATFALGAWYFRKRSPYFAEDI
jgi:ABC-2 type transport system permease protein